MTHTNIQMLETLLRKDSQYLILGIDYDYVRNVGGGRGKIGRMVSTRRFSTKYNEKMNDSSYIINKAKLFTSIELIDLALHSHKNSMFYKDIIEIIKPPKTEFKKPKNKYEEEFLQNLFKHLGVK